MSRSSSLAGAAALLLMLGACELAPEEPPAAADAPGGKADDPAGSGDGGGSLSLATFNVEFFGSTTSGPVDEALQTDNVARIIAAVSPDVIGLQEIVSLDALDDLGAQLPEYELLSAADPRVVGGLEHYGPDAFTYLGLGFRRDRVELVGARVIPNVVAGRAPLEVSLLVHTDTGSLPLTVVVVHLAPFAWPDRWELRRTQADALKAYLDERYPDELVAVVGDFNDDVDESTVEGFPTPFEQFWNDPDYYFPTYELSSRNQSTTVEWPSAIDHQLVSDELWRRYLSRTAWVERPAYIADYRETTSDHYLVHARYRLGD